MTDEQIIIDDQKKTIHRLQDECTEKTNAIIALGEQLKRKEQECEELKIYIESNEQQVKEVETLVMDNDRLINELDQLKQNLTEIKEIAKEAGNTQYLTFPDFNLKQNVKMLMGQFNGYLQQILQKISECEVE